MVIYLSFLSSKMHRTTTLFASIAVMLLALVTSTQAIAGPVLGDIGLGNGQSGSDNPGDGSTPDFF